MKKRYWVILFSILTIVSILAVAPQSSLHQALEDTFNREVLSNIDNNTESTAENTDTVEPKLDDIRRYQKDTSEDTDAIASVQTNVVQNADILTEAHLPFGGLAVRTFENLLHIESDEGNTVTEERNDVVENGGVVSKSSNVYRVNGTATLDTDRLTEYQAGSAAQIGMGIQIPEDVEEGEVVRWGMFNDKTGLYFKLNSTCLSANLRRDGEAVRSTCQENWNMNTLNGTSYTNSLTGEEVNREEYNLSTDDMNIYEITYAWYGGGIMKFQVVMDNEEWGQSVETGHVIDFDQNVSIQETSLPLRVEVNDTSGAEDVNVFVGGRQASILSDYDPAARKTILYRSNITLDTTNQWEHVLSFKHKEDFKNINIDVLTISGNYGCDSEWAVYRNTNANISSFNSGFFFEDPNETSLETNRSAEITFTGSPEKKLAEEALLVDAGQVSSGGNKKDFATATRNIDSTISREEAVSWFVRRTTGTSCTHNSLTLTATEDY